MTQVSGRQTCEAKGKHLKVRSRNLYVAPVKSGILGSRAPRSEAQEYHSLQMYFCPSTEHVFIEMLLRLIDDLCQPISRLRDADNAKL